MGAAVAVGRVFALVAGFAEVGGAAALVVVDGDSVVVVEGAAVAVGSADGVAVDTGASKKPK